MDELIAFLTACLDEDEQAAREALARTTTSRRMIEGRMVTVTNRPPAWRQSVWPPERVLAEIAAKRQILNDLVPDINGMDGMIEGEWGHHSPAADRLLELLALPYADRPGYREDWRP